MSAAHDDVVARLQAAQAPDPDGGRVRGWNVVRTTLREKRGPRRLALLPVLATAAVAAALVVLVASGAGHRTANWVSDRVAGEPAKHITVTPLPAGGRLLVKQDDGSLAVLRADGTHTRLGSVTGATWSPHGLFVATWSGRDLRALEPDGDPRWHVRAPAAVQSVTWSPDGFRLAYIADLRLHVLAGDGTGDRTLVGGNVNPVRPAWVPGPRHILAYLTWGNLVVLRDADTGALVRATKRIPISQPFALAASPDGRTLELAGLHRIAIVDTRSGRVRYERIPKDVTSITGIAFAPQGHTLADGTPQLAVLLDRAGKTTLIVAGRELVTVRGRLLDPLWSADGKAIAVTWPEGHEVLVVTARRGRLTTLRAQQAYAWAP